MNYAEDEWLRAEACIGLQAYIAGWRQRSGWGFALFMSQRISVAGWIAYGTMKL